MTVSLDTPIAVYVHVPWCASICPYCDFPKQASDFGLVDPFVDAVIRHIEAEPPRRAHSLFFGGGTPSLLMPARLGRLIDAWRARFTPRPDAEVTIEANPSDVVAHKVEAYLRAGVTRLSLGVQSLDDAELRFLGRRHTADKAVRAAQAIRAAGCTNFSVDLMYGLPNQPLDAVRRSLDGLLALEPAHVSCYALSIEEGTPFGMAAQRGRLQALDDDAVAEAYALIQRELSAAGFVQYELSNWARPGRVSIHNLTYWRNGEWIGLGPGAAGSCAGVRYTRVADVRGYIAAALADEPAYAELEPWTREGQLRDTLMLGLRLAEGVGDAALAARFGRHIVEACTDRLPELARAGVLHWQGDRLTLDPASYFVCNAVLAELLPADLIAA